MKYIFLILGYPTFFIGWIIVCIMFILANIFNLVWEFSIIKWIDYTKKEWNVWKSKPVGDENPIVTLKRFMRTIKWK